MLAALAIATLGLTPAPADTACITMNTDRMPVAGRPSPLDSLTIAVGAGAVKVCYGRPSARGRTMIGGEPVPYDRLWRTGANEPTMLHATVPVTVAGVHVEAGSYSLYTVPGRDAWEVIVNRSITQWGHEGRYTDAVRAQEVGRGRASARRAAPHVEQFTIAPADDGIELQWEGTRVRVPLAAGGA